ncbi:MFS transporter [Xylophilus sp.]|uniref:MFS transporter n=1 Tax=Xylophilus sp. TaxID=2653893 RepID=UPI0013B7EE4C|nr:MFS transporter [Xylophilus sp.]KAF1046097.1 MAG: hypothetical protein GAK38_02655 [Xylophilus sp.]
MMPGLLSLVAAQVFLHACMTGVRLAAPLLALRAGYSAAAVGMLLALFALTQVFLALPAGRYADRHGLRRPLAIAVGVAVGGAALAAAWPVFPVLCAAALATGGASGAASIVLQRHVGRIAEGATALRQAFSWLALGPAVSSFIGPFSAGLAIDLAGFRAAFALLALLPLASWWCARGVTELPPVAPPPGASRARVWDLLREGEFRRLLLINWIVSSCWDVHTFLVPVIGNERALSASAIGTVLGSFAVAAALVRLALPLLAQRLRESAVVAWAMAAVAAVFAVYPLMRGAWGMAACSVLLGLALGAVQPMIMSMLHQITPHERHGEALGLRLMAINASSVAMPMLFGSAGAALGAASVFWVIGVAVALGTRTAWRLGRSL